MKKILFLAAILCSALTQAQNKVSMSMMTGICTYSGDLNGGKISYGVGLDFRYRISGFFGIRTGVNYGKTGGLDSRGGKDILKARNLNFETNILEFNAILEINAFDEDEFTLFPYGFAGLGLFHMNPYTYDKNNKKQDLQPLSTEGQGLPSYGGKPYSLTQFCLPFGAGVKKTFGQSWTIAFEWGWRKTFTDYLDDVSTFYPDCETLTTTKGETATELSWRGDELMGKTDECPPAGGIRGNSKKKDWYSFGGFRLSYRFGKKEKDKTEEW